jgi:asparagine synthase (glutamine-hydrolysing)
MQAPPGSHNKHLLRKVVSGLLPGDVFDRPKTGFSLPIGDWIAGPLTDACDAAVETAASCPLLNAAGVRSLWCDYRTNWNQVHWSRPLGLVVLGSYLGTLRDGH